MAGQGKPGRKRLDEYTPAEQAARAKRLAAATEARLPSGATRIVRRMARDGATQAQIAEALGLSAAGWTRAKKAMPRLQRIYDEEREKERVLLHSHALKIATRDEGQTSSKMTQFLLTNKHNYRADAPDESNAPRLRVEITLPDALSREEYARLVEVDKRTIEGEAKPARPAGGALRIARG